MPPAPATVSLPWPKESILGNLFGADQEHSAPPETLLPRKVRFAEIVTLLISAQPQAQSRDACLLTQYARIRASLFNFQLPLDFAAVWLRERLFEQKPGSGCLKIADFCFGM